MSQTPRRSSRLGQGSATPAPPSARSTRAGSTRGGNRATSVAGTITSINSTTPGRSARRRTALPAIPTNLSSAYGASGQAAVAQQLQSQTTGFAAAFDQERGNVADLDTTSKATSRAPSELQDMNSNRPPVPLFSEEPADATLTEGFTTLNDISKSFGEGHEGGMFNIATAEPSNTSQPRLLDSDDESDEPTPSAMQRGIELAKNCSRVVSQGIAHSLHSTASSIRRFAEVTRRTIKRTPIAITAALFLIIFPAIVGYLLTGYMSSTDFSNGSAGNRILGNIENFTNHAWSAVPSIPRLQWRRSQWNFSLDDLSIEELKKDLPDMVVVVRDENTGKYRVKENFWQALVDKIAAKQSSATQHGSSWKTFLKQNEASINALMSEEFGKQFNPHLRTALRDYHIVTRDVFTSMLRDNFAELSDKIAAIASKVSAAQIRQLPLQHLNTVAQANLIQNSELALKTVNFFSPGLGAVVDPYLTSPTQSKAKTWGQKLYTKFIWVPGNHPPVMALEPWEDSTHCWCAAPSKHGKAQLAVILPHAIFPKKITVDHIPKEGTLDIRSAPREFELWAEIDSIEDVNHLERAQLASEGLFGPPPSTSLTTKYVLIHKWQYDLGGSNHVQTSTIELDLERLGIQVKKVVVRVAENWGREWTCLYRLRLHGELTSEPTFD